MLIGILILMIQLIVTAQDYSTPQNGNLYIEGSIEFSPNRMEIYPNAEVLKKQNLVLEENRIYSNTIERRNIVNTNKTKGSDKVWINQERYVILTGNSAEYPHGILGDSIESTGFEVYDGENLIVKYELPKGRVFETLRATIAEIVSENKGKEIILTSSDKENGSRVDIYSQSGELLGVSSPIGRGFRWLHILGVGRFDNSNNQYIAIVKTPHIGGKFEMLSWRDGSLKSEALIDGVSTHKIGSDNLNMGLLIDTDAYGSSEIIVPSQNYRNLLIIKFSNKRLKVLRKFELSSAIVTNLYYDNAGTPSVWFALDNGKVVRIGE
jgi:hypothetical protein